MPGWLKNLQIFFQDPNNQKFAIGLLALFLVAYVLKGETGNDKLQRFFKLLLAAALVFFVYGLYYFFIKS